MSATLVARIADVRRKHLSVSAANGAALAISFLVLALAVEMFFDWLIDLPIALRAIALVIDLSVVGYLLSRFIIQPMLAGPDEDELALAIEREHERFGGRLIATVQLSRPEALSPGISEVMVRVTVEQAERIAADFDFGRVVKMDPLKRRAAVAAGALLLALVLLAAWAPSSMALLRRAMLSIEPVPRKTRVMPVTTGELVAIGDDVPILADAAGIRPSYGSVEIRYQSGASQTLNMSPLSNPVGRFGGTMQAVQESFKFQVRLGDGHGDWYNVTALARPSLAGVDFWQIYPAYTHLPPVHRMPGDLILLEGSRLVVALTASRALRPNHPGQQPFNRVHLTGGAMADDLLQVGQTISDLPSPVRPPAAAELEAATAEDGIAIPSATTGLSIYLVDQDGLESKDPAVYPIAITPAPPPIVRINIADHREQLVTRIATVDVPYEATDQFGLATLSLRYKVDNGVERGQDLPLVGSPRSIGGTYSWDVSSIPPEATTRPSLEGSSVEFWLRAENTNIVTRADHKPVFADSEHYQLRVVTAEEKRQELLSRAGEIPTAISQTADRQEEDNQKLGQAIMNGALPTTQPGGN